MGNSALRVLQPNIPGTVDGWSWNGSLWSLFFEFMAYCGAAVLLTLAVARRHARYVVPAVYGLSAFGVWWAFGPGEVTTSLFLLSVKMAAYFLAGMALYFWADRIPVDGRLALLAVVAATLCWMFDVMDVLGAIPLAYILLWLGAVVPPRWAQRHDVSYGIYIYAFPVQTLLEWFLPSLSVPAHVVLAMVLVTPLAWASWLLIERPAMRLKHVGRRSPGHPGDRGPDPAVVAADGR